MKFAILVFGCVLMFIAGIRSRTFWDVLLTIGIWITASLGHFV